MGLIVIILRFLVPYSASDFVLLWAFPPHNCSMAQSCSPATALGKSQWLPCIILRVPFWASGPTGAASMASIWIGAKIPFTCTISVSTCGGGILQMKYYLSSEKKNIKELNKYLPIFNSHIFYLVDSYSLVSIYFTSFLKSSSAHFSKY